MKEETVEETKQGRRRRWREEKRTPTGETETNLVARHNQLQRNPLSLSTERALSRAFFVLALSSLHPLSELSIHRRSGEEGAGVAGPRLSEGNAKGITKKRALLLVKVRAALKRAMVQFTPPFRFSLRPPSLSLSPATGPASLPLRQGTDPCPLQQPGVARF